MYTPSLYDIVMILVASVAAWCVAYILGKAVGFHAHLKSVSDSLDRGNAYAAAVKDIEMFCTDHSKAASLITRYIRVVAGRGKERPSPIDLAFELVEHDQSLLAHQPLTVRILSFPESNGKRNWTAMIVRKKKWDGLIGNAGGITIARGEYWNRVAYVAEQAKYLLAERDTEPFILDFGDDIETPEQWAGEVEGPVRAAAREERRKEKP